MMSELSSTTNTMMFINPLTAYWTDAWQRSVLCLDIMRRRGPQYEEQSARSAPHVPDYAAELVCDGRSLEKPVNYVLAHIIPPLGVVIVETKRPFVVVDPLAGHGPGIGGKADSEIGVAMKGGMHAISSGFLPEPVPGQTYRPRGSKVPGDGHRAPSGSRRKAVRHRERGFPID